MYMADKEEWIVVKPEKVVYLSLEVTKSKRKYSKQFVVVLLITKEKSYK